MRAQEIDHAMNGLGPLLGIVYLLITSSIVLSIVNFQTKGSKYRALSIVLGLLGFAVGIFGFVLSPIIGIVLTAVSILLFVSL